MRIHILSDGMRAPNSIAFLYPILVHANALHDQGIEVRVFETSEGPYADCDPLIVDSKHFSGPQRGQLGFVQERLGRFGAACKAVVWFDTTDSAGWLVGAVLPLVRRYYKNQLLCDRDAYTRPMYGRRLYSDYYHRRDGVEDESPEDVPQVTERKYLRRLRLGWNSGLADYTRWGPFRMALYRRTGLAGLLSEIRRDTSANGPRSIAVSCRMGVSYARNTVAFQRRKIKERLADYTNTRKLKRGAYFEELRKSRLVLSPFGLGEITLKDFEVFLTGGLLLKPDMSHLETWPNFYRPSETVETFAWDLSDPESVVDELLSNEKRVMAISATGQEHYLRHVCGPQAPELFVDHFRQLVAEAIADGD